MEKELANICEEGGSRNIWENQIGKSNKNVTYISSVILQKT